MAAVGSALLSLQVTLNADTAERDNTVCGQPFCSLFAFVWSHRKRGFGYLQVIRRQMGKKGNK